jgi:hypothetical protein
MGVLAVPAGAATAGSTSCPAVAIGENAQHSGHTCSVLSTSPVKRWAKTLNGYPSEPLIAGSRVFVTTTDPAGSGGWLYALSRITGKTLWGPVPLASVYHWFPLGYDNGRVFVNNFEGNLRAFDATTGRMLWMQQTGAFGGQPVATAGRVYVHGGYSVSALRETTGSRVWATKYLDGDGSTVGVDGTGVYVSTGCQSRFRLSLSTGAALWRGNPGCSGGGGGTAALWAGRMYASDGYFVLDMATGHTLGGFAGTPAFNGSRGYFAIGTAVFAEDVSTQTPKWTVDRPRRADRRHAGDHRQRTPRRHHRGRARHRAQRHNRHPRVHPHRRGAGPKRPVQRQLDRHQHRGNDPDRTRRQIPGRVRLGTRNHGRSRVGQAPPFGQCLPATGHAHS